MRETCGSRFRGLLVICRRSLCRVSVAELLLLEICGDSSALFICTTRQFYLSKTLRNLLLTSTSNAGGESRVPDDRIQESGIWDLSLDNTQSKMNCCRVCVRVCVNSIWGRARALSSQHVLKFSRPVPSRRQFNNAHRNTRVERIVVASRKERKKVDQSISDEICLGRWW